jgi:hypothetical protein
MHVEAATGRKHHAGGGPRSYNYLTAGTCWLSGWEEQRDKRNEVHWKGSPHPHFDKTISSAM